MFQHSGFHATTCIKTSEVDWHGHLLQFIEASDICGQARVSLTQDDIVSFRLRWTLKWFWCCFMAKTADRPVCLGGCGCLLWGTWLVWMNEAKSLGHAFSSSLEKKGNTCGYYHCGLLHVKIRIILLPSRNKYKQNKCIWKFSFIWIQLSNMCHSICLPRQKTGHIHGLSFDMKTVCNNNKCPILLTQHLFKMFSVTSYYPGCHSQHSGDIQDCVWTLRMATVQRKPNPAKVFWNFCMSFGKMAALADTLPFHGGSISEKNTMVMVYICAKFHASTYKPTILPYFSHICPTVSPLVCMRF